VTCEAGYDSEAGSPRVSASRENEVELKLKVSNMVCPPGHVGDLGFYHRGLLNMDIRTRVSES
jgi:hypothetical protein